MFKSLKAKIVLASIVAAISGIVAAQVINGNSFPYWDVRGPLTTQTMTASGKVTGRHFASVQTTPPVCSTNCGTTPTVTGSDSAMKVTLGTTPASGFLVTFDVAYAAAPSCHATMGTAGMVIGKLPLTVVTTTTTLTVVTNGTAPSTGDIYNIACTGML